MNNKTEVVVKIANKKDLEDLVDKLTRQVNEVKKTLLEVKKFKLDIKNSD